MGAPSGTGRRLSGDLFHEPCHPSRRRLHGAGPSPWHG